MIHAKDLAHIKEIFQLFEKGEAHGLGAVTYEGKRVDYANYKKTKDFTSHPVFIRMYRKMSYRKLKSIFLQL